MMPDLIANSVFKSDGKEYRPGDLVSPELPDIKKLMEKGFVVYRGGKVAAEKAIAKAKAEEEAKAAAEAEEKARKEAEEKAAAEAAEKKTEEKSGKGRKGKVEE